MGQYIADQIIRCTNNQIDVRTSVLGHIQRGGLPSALDRLLATTFGKVAVDMVAQEKYNCIVTWQNGKVVPMPIEEVLRHSPLGVDPNGYLVKTARSLGVYLGDS